MGTASRWTRLVVSLLLTGSVIVLMLLLALPAASLQAGGSEWASGKMT
jgi:hypothetical protein